MLCFKIIIFAGIDEEKFRCFKFNIVPNFCLDVGVDFNFVLKVSDFSTGHSHSVVFIEDFACCLCPLRCTNEYLQT